MGKLAFIFPGQGAQYAGMGKDIAENYKEAMEIFDKANASLEFNIKDLCFNGPEEELKKTEITQPAILTVSVAILQVLNQKGIIPDVVAGLSLGEYTALVASSVISFEDAVVLVRKRGKFMQEAVPLGVGGMAAILGLSKEEVMECCKKASSEGIVEPANFNCPGQIVIAGELRALDRAMEYAKELGAKRATILPVSAPFHCKMLIPAGEKLKEELDKISFNDLKIPVISNVTADYILNKNQIKELLVKQVYSPVLWEDTIVKMLSDGVDTFIEVGPGKTLSAFVKKISKNARVHNIEDTESLQKTIGEIER